MPSEEELMQEVARLKEELAREREKFDTVLQSIVDGVYTTDSDREVTFWNKGAERITGFSSAEVMGKTCKELLAHTDENGVSLCETACPLSETMKQGAPIYGKNVMSRTAWGKPAPISVSCAPLLAPDGKVVGAVEVFRDISEMKRLEKQKADIITMITHDLKTPLTVILGYGDMLVYRMELAGDKEGVEFASGIITSGERIQSMIEDFLSISKIESGVVPLNLQQFPVDDLVRRVVNDLLVLAGKKGVNLRLLTEPGIPPARFDTRLMERALSNLATNAIKFTPAGGVVTVSTRLLEDSAKPFVEITVADTGHGIPEADLDRVFDRFYRAKTSDGFEGAGLGLAIVKAFVEAHGGSVSAANEPGSGAMFKILLPLDRNVSGAVAPE